MKSERTTEGPTATETREQEGRPTCRVCHRPQVACLCATVEPLCNRTPIFILQHPKEARHPIGTARIATAGLRNCELHLAGRQAVRSIEAQFEVPDGCAVLYPGEQARPLGEVVQDTATPTPTGLVVLDGTWPCARALWRANPWLHRLPQVSLSPQAPGNYRIRKEPAAHCLSTVEAIIAALRELEPNLHELDRLTQAFDAMVDRHLELRRRVQPATGADGRTLRRRIRKQPRLPHQILRASPEQLVHIYCEGRRGLPGDPKNEQARQRRGQGRPLLRLTALRHDGRLLFDRLLAAPANLALPETAELLATNLRHAGIPRAMLTEALGAEAFADSFQAALPDDPIFVAWNSGNFMAYRNNFAPSAKVHSLKSVYRQRPKSNKTSCLNTVMRLEGLATSQSMPLVGRAGERLNAARQLLDHLR